MKTLNQTRAVKLEPFSRSPVDIIVPYHGQYEKVTKLIESIMYGTKSNPYQIVLVDDCSPNKSFILSLEDTPQVLTYRTPHQLGFAGALKYGFDRTHQPWVVFMHSDCIVEETNWLIEMGRSLLRWKEEKSPVRMVSARTDNPGDGTDPHLQAEHHSITEDFVLEEGHLPLYCAMCHRELFNRIGGFLKTYPFAWYEDEELAYRMRKRGFKQGICGRSWVRHEGGVTIRSVWEENPAAKAIMEENRNRCLADMRLLN